MKLTCTVTVYFDDVPDKTDLENLFVDIPVEKIKLRDIPSDKKINCTVINFLTETVELSKISE